MSSEAETVRASGGLVWRPSGTASGFEVLIVHRPNYDDWSFPKGRRDLGESAETCALREVLEETGFACGLGRELAAVRYRDSSSRPKEVRYWAMRVESGEFRENEEVDALRWVDLESAGDLLTYPGDTSLLASLKAHLEELGRG